MVIFRVSCEIQILHVLGLEERSLRAFRGGDFDTDLRVRLYRSLEREWDVLLSDDEEMLGLRLVHLAGDDFFGEIEGLLLLDFLLTGCDNFFSSTLELLLLAELEALLLLEEVSEEDPDELTELERDLLELPALLCDEELHKSYRIKVTQLMHTTSHLECLFLPLSRFLSLPRGGVRLRELDRLLLLLSLLRLLLRSLTPLYQFQTT